MVVLDNRTGDVLARLPLAGRRAGRRGRRAALARLRAEAVHLLLALENGAAPATVLADVPAKFPIRAGGVYRPENYGRRCSGPVALRSALACSLNIPAVRVLSARVPGGPGALRQRQTSFTIAFPLPGSLYALDADLPAASRRLPLRTRGESSAKPPRWECATLPLEPNARGAGTVAVLREGRHVLRAQDPATGEWRETWITVRAL